VICCSLVKVDPLLICFDCKQYWMKYEIVRRMMNLNERNIAIVEQN
jgi:hypothetical protein